MDPAEAEFVAESASSVEIVPNFTQNTTHLLEGDVGPFKAGIPLTAPLWLAVGLRQRRKCRVLHPEWLKTDKLEDLKESERESAYFVRMPHPHFFAVAQILLTEAVEDLEKPDAVKTLVKDVWDLRQSKLRKSVDAFVLSGRNHAQLDHLQLIEMNSIRPLLPKTLDQVKVLEDEASKVTNNASSFNLSSGF